MLNFDDLTTGDRIVVRFRLENPAAGAPSVSDALGQLLAVDQHTLRIQTRQDVVTVPRERITHAKRVPPQAVRRPRRPPVDSPEA